MKIYSKLLLLTFLLTFFGSVAQVKNEYTISFDNAVHHEANVVAKFTNIQPGVVTIEMARTAPPDIGVYNFAKNIYNLKITNVSGKDVKLNKIGLNKWNVDDHDGGVLVSYTVFGDKGNGIFSQFSDERVIVNNPATFMYIASLKNRPVEVTYSKGSHSNWKIATQLKDLGNDVYYAQNLEEFMDSPALLADFMSKDKIIESGKKEYNLRLAINDEGGDAVAETLIDKVNLVIDKQKDVFGGFPNFQNENYQFLVNFDPSASEGISAHKNSSLITNSNSLSKIEMTKVVKMLSKTFFQSWMKTRMRPLSEVTFDLQKNSIIEEHWFLEGFTNYYTLLTLCRSGVISQDKFIEELSYISNAVTNSPGTDYQNINKMSEKIVFYEGLSKYADPQNIPNIYIPVEQYGTLVALVLDLSLRNQDGLNLDDFMKLFWTKYGKTEIGFSNENIFTTLREYAGESFADDFFKDYITKGDVKSYTKYKKELESVGINTSPVEIPYLGAEVLFNDDELAEISKYTKRNTPAYQCGLEKGDIIMSIDNKPFSNMIEFKNSIAQSKIGKKVTIKYNRNGVEKNAIAKLVTNPNIIFNTSTKQSTKVIERRRLWLGEQK